MFKRKAEEVNEEEVTKAGSTKTTIRWLITKEDGSENYATRRIEIQPDGEVGLHQHPEEHHIYVLEGEAKFINKDGKTEFTAVKGEVIFIPPNESHKIKNETEETFIFLCIIPYLN